MIVEPSPALGKSANPTDVVGGQTVTYTLTASNAAGASEMHDAWVVDCLPAGLTFDAYRTPSQGSTVTPIPGAGAPCAAGTTQLAWNVGDVDPGAGPDAGLHGHRHPGGHRQRDVHQPATLTGDSLAGTRSGPTDPGNPDGRLYTATANQTITVLGATLTKSADPTIDTIGQTVTYTVVGVLNPNVSYFNLSLIDTLPAGLDPNSVKLVSQDCENQDGTACDLTPGTILTPAPNGASTKIGLFFGNVAGEDHERTITILYNARVADVAAASAGDTLTNSAHLAWDNTSKPPPTDRRRRLRPDLGQRQRPDRRRSSRACRSPSRWTTRPSSRARPSTTRWTCDNADTATTSAAYNVSVTDAIPAGVVGPPGIHLDGGALTGPTATVPAA